MTSTSYSVFGVSMQRQRTRRKLVVTVYALLLVLCAVSIAGATRYSLLYVYVCYAAMAVGMFVFGGMGQKGLLKGFENKPPRTQQMPLLEVERLRLLPKAEGEQDLSWKNDERELSRRNLAHYKAYQIVGLGGPIILLLAAWALFPKQHLLSVTTILVMIFGLAEMLTILMVTLPAAIILWTEPDIDLG
jgi:hypothetical protein